MHRQPAERKRRIKTAMEIMTRVVPLYKSVFTELRDTGNVSKRNRGRLRRSSKACMKVYPPSVVLLLQERAFEAGHKEAATDALLLAAKEKVVAPHWALEGWAESQRSGSNKKDGRPALHPSVVLWRVWAVERCAKQRKHGRDHQGDKYDRAHRLLETLNPRLFAGLPVLVSAAAVKKTYRDFQQSGRLGYMSQEFFQ